jgi:hypothetical protein
MGPLQMRIDQSLRLRLRSSLRQSGGRFAALLDAGLKPRSTSEAKAKAKRGKSESEKQKAEKQKAKSKREDEDKAHSYGMTNKS